MSEAPRSITRGLQLIDTRFGAMFGFPDDLISQQLSDYGAHTRNELAMLLDHVPEGAVVVDIGAHIGTYAIPLAKRAGPAGRVFAIEANDETYQVLLTNIGMNGLVNRISVGRQIVGEGHDQAFDRVELANNTGAGHYRPTPQGQKCVDAYGLLAVNGFAQPDVIKIDVEGMECSILRSLQPILQRRRPILYLEVVCQQLARFGETPDSIDDLLRPHGYIFYRNKGERNSSHDTYQKTLLARVSDGGEFFDLLALPQGYKQTLEANLP